ncbi:hypothetical protein B0H67DRAFT_554487 [Lasiosphaeris hirsuta]|uniref:BTB domain-containing protein n=1 Tax=Lasiosphaeris hirsuta TaxID=260670 RepID=A0AA40AHV3_9PEZI|nr:hypothetical protein B0H67DRAFT_554487 [Lasiosphaeris hirsuta]
MANKLTCSPVLEREALAPVLEPITVAPSGDVIMVVGKEKRRMRVHSVILSAASPVFKVMFGPNFSEGNHLSTVDPKEIPLPKDNEDALQTIFYIVHFRPDAINDPPSPDLLLQVAIAANKYGFVNALKHPLQAWINDSAIQEPEKLWKLVMASFWIQKEDYFKSTTKKTPGMGWGAIPPSRVYMDDQMPPDAASRFFGKALSYSGTLCIHLQRLILFKQ